MIRLEEIAASKPRARRWLQISIRSCLIVITLLCVWLGLRVNHARKQRAIIAAARESGGNPLPNWQFAGGDGRFVKNNNWVNKPTIPGPPWLRERMGEEYFDTIVETYFVGDKVTDQSLSRYIDALQVRGVEGPIGLTLDNVAISDRGFAQVSELVGLQYLVAHVPGVTEVGFQCIRKLTGLRRLQLNFNRLRNDVLKSVSELSRLEELALRHTGITDGALVHLQGLRNLHYVDLRQTSVTSDGVRRLQEALPDCLIEVEYRGR